MNRSRRRSARDHPRDLTISNAPLAGINSNNPADAGWLIEAVEIEETGDSGIYFKGSNFVIANSTIVDTGIDASIRYPRHAIYAAGPDATIVNNTIADFSTSGISLRCQNAFVEGNRISGGAKGISFDNQATAPGTTDILYNTISDVSDTGIVVATPASESFLVTDNTIVGAGNYGIYVQVVPALTIAKQHRRGDIRHRKPAERPPPDVELLRAPQPLVWGLELALLLERLGENVPRLSALQRARSERLGARPAARCGTRPERELAGHRRRSDRGRHLARLLGPVRRPLLPFLRYSPRPRLQ